MRAVHLSHSLVLVVPCYNEQHRLPVDAFRAFTVDGIRVELLFVNDGSTDGTLRLLEKLQHEDPSRFSVLNLARNSGKAEAVRQGILAALSAGRITSASGTQTSPPRCRS
jgi:glycosyltransferase involved in cell wall biosynthesis